MNIRVSAPNASDALSAPRPEGGRLRNVEMAFRPLISVSLAALLDTAFESLDHHSVNLFRS